MVEPNAIEGRVFAPPKEVMQELIGQLTVVVDSDKHLAPESAVNEID